MHLSSLATAVKLANVGQTTHFTMEDNEFAFRVMSDGLYQNKIGSCVRETACNGLDSHVEAGKGDLPIQIHLPDVEEPYYSIRDFGIGLDDWGVRCTFATYFRSTKRKNNLAVGAFGLGSKTPFAYTDAFTITAIKDGKIRHFAAFIGEDGKPSVTNMGGDFSAVYSPLNDDFGPVKDRDGNPTEILDQWNETDEGNGVTVMLPVTSERDFQIFRHEVQQQLTFFPVKPEILNGTVTWADWKASAKYMEIENVFIGESFGGSRFSGLWILQGPVGYKADLELLKQNVAPNNKEFLEIIGDCAVLRFNLGEIEVTPSREGVSYSKRTIAAVDAMLNKARDAMTDSVQARVDALGDPWATATGINADSVLRRLVTITKAKFEALGYYRSGQFYMLDLERIANIDGLESFDSDSAEVALNFDTPVYDDEDGEEEEDESEEDENTVADRLNLQFRLHLNERVARSRRGKRKWRESTTARHAKADPKSFIVVVRDTDHKPTVRLRSFLARMSALESNAVHVLQQRGGRPLDADQIAAVRERIGASWEPLFLSELPLPAKHQAGSREYYKPPSAFTYEPHDNPSNTQEWKREANRLKLFDGAYYVTTYRNGTNVSATDRLVFELADMGLLDKPIMAIRYKDAEKLADNPNWIPVSVKTAEIMDAVRDNKRLHNARAVAGIHTSHGTAGIDSSLYVSLQEACKDGRIHADSPLHKLGETQALVAKLKARYADAGYNSIMEKAMKLAYIDNMAPQLNNALKARVDKLREPLDKAYPLLAFMFPHHGNAYQSPVGKLDEIIAYINAKHAGE